MAHFAKLGIGNKIEKVEVISNDVWKQTSYNTLGGVHKLGGTPFRKNFAGIGDKYDQTKDAFIRNRPHNSWILNETSCLWEAPIVKPNDGQSYDWNESTLSWDLRE